jgi:hypothetical protein
LGSIPPKLSLSSSLACSIASVEVLSILMHYDALWNWPQLFPSLHPQLLQCDYAVIPMKRYVSLPWKLNWFCDLHWPRE